MSENHNLADNLGPQSAADGASRVRYRLPNSITFAQVYFYIDGWLNWGEKIGNISSRMCLLWLIHPLIASLSFFAARVPIV